MLDGRVVEITYSVTMSPLYSMDGTNPLGLIFRYSAVRGVLRSMWTVSKSRPSSLRMTWDRCAHGQKYEVYSVIFGASTEPMFAEWLSL